MTGTGQQVAQLHDRYITMMMMMMRHYTFRAYRYRRPIYHIPKYGTLIAYEVCIRWNIL